MKRFRAKDSLLRSVRFSLKQGPMVSFPKYQTLLGETPPYWVAKLPSSEEFSCHSRGTKPPYCTARDAPREANKKSYHFK